MPCVYGAYLTRRGAYGSWATLARSLAHLLRPPADQAYSATVCPGFGQSISSRGVSRPPPASVSTAGHGRRQARERRVHTAVAPLQDTLRCTRCTRCGYVCLSNELLLPTSVLRRYWYGRRLVTYLRSMGAVWWPSVSSGMAVVACWATSGRARSASASDVHRESPPSL